MNQITVYNGEHIDRGPIWYVLTLSFMIFLVLYSFFQGSLMWWISVAFIFLVIVVWYVISYLTSMKKIKIQLNDWFLVVWDKTYSFDKILWINAEFDNAGKIKTFIITTSDNPTFPLRFTVADDEENIKNFITKALESGLQLYDWYEKDKFYKIVRALKL